MGKRVAVVSGGMGGLGTAICRRLAQDGCRVIAVDLANNEERIAAFRDRRTLRFAGWTKALPPMGRKGEDSQLPAVTVGEVLKLVKLDPRQHFTKPPARFTEAALVRELEKRGIGRPSTYASIISTIVDRGYVRVESRRFFAEKMGEIVTDRLVENFVELMNYEFTAKMEDKLDGIAEGSLEWKKVLDAFYAHHCVLHSLKQYPADNAVGHASLVFELCYPESLRIVDEQGWLWRLLDFKTDNPDTAAAFAAIRDELHRWLNAQSA